MSLNLMKKPFNNTLTNCGSLVRICLTLVCLFAGNGLASAADLAPSFSLDRPEAGDSIEAGDTIESEDGTGSDSFNDNSSFSDPEEIRTRAPAKPPVAPVHTGDELTEEDKIKLRLSARYGNPVVERFIYSKSPETVVRLYNEIANLIDSRHLEPTSYETRTRRALTNLSFALENKEFNRVNRLSLSGAQIINYRKSLERVLASTTIRTNRDAINVMYTVINLSTQQLKLRGTTVALEFVYGEVESLDKYSAIELEEPARAPSASALDDHVVGIGVEIKPHEEGILIVKPLLGGPAAAAGVKPGDVVVAINGQTLKGKSLDFAADQIGGASGSKVTLNIVRGGKAMPSLTLIRRRVEILSVSESRMLEGTDGVGYIKLDKFAQTSSAEVDKALWNLYRSGMTALVIDLRGNPGGLLTTAIELSDKFLPQGSIVSTHGRNPQDESSENAKYAQTWKIPMAVLVDGNSASASEIFAAAIQENGRGLVVGRKSYGKGTVQTSFPLSSVSGNVRLTTAKFFSPNGRVMAGAGVTPDILVEAEENADVFGFVIDKDIKAAVKAAQSERSVAMAAKPMSVRTQGNN